MLKTKVLFSACLSLVVSSAYCMEDMNNSFHLFTEEKLRKEDNVSASSEDSSVAESADQLLARNIKGFGEEFARQSGEKYWALTDKFKNSIGAQGALYNHCVSHNTVERQKYIDIYLSKSKKVYDASGKNWESIASTVLSAFVYQSFKLEVEDTWHKLPEKFAKQTSFKNYNDFLFEETKKDLLDRMQVVSQFGVTNEVKRHIADIKHNWDCYCGQYSVFTDGDAKGNVAGQKSVIEQLRQIEMNKVCKDLPKNYESLLGDLSKIADRVDDLSCKNAISGLISSKDECLKNLLVIYKALNNASTTSSDAKKVGEALDNFMNKSGLYADMTVLLNSEDDNARELGILLDKMVQCITERTSDKIMIASEDNSSDIDVVENPDGKANWNYYGWRNWDDVRTAKVDLFNQPNSEGFIPYWKTFCQWYTSGNDGGLRKVDVGLRLPWTSNPYDHVFDINEDAWIVTELPYQNFEVGDTEEFLKQRRNEYYVKLRNAAINGYGELHARILNKLLSVIDLAEKLGLSLEYNPDAIGDLNTLEEARALAVHFPMFDENLWNAFVTKYYNVDGNVNAVFDFKKDNWIVKKLPLIPSKAAKALLEQKRKEYYSELARLSGSNVVASRQSLLMKLEGLKALTETIVEQE